MAALRAYEDEGLIERSRILGARMLAMLREVQERVPAIGDVRGGHGLFAVVELVKDRNTREPVAPWPQSLTPPCAARRDSSGCKHLRVPALPSTGWLEA